MTLFFFNVFYTVQDFDSDPSDPYDRRKDRGNVTRKINHRQFLSLQHLPQNTLKEVSRNSSQYYGKDKNSAHQQLVDVGRTIPTSVQHTLPGELFDPTKYTYITENPDVCAGASIYIIIFVHSAADHFQIRDRIRRTWASLVQYGEDQIRTVFMLGRPSNQSVQHRINMESSSNKDIVQMDFVDHYRNLSLKHIMSLGWISAHCGRAQYVVKADDDTIVNVYELLTFLKVDYRAAPITNHLYCSVYGNMTPRRDRGDKWYVSEKEYPYKKYPPYCEGFAYVTGTSVTGALYRAAQDVSLYWIDDVYVTGILLQKLGLGHRQFRRTRGYDITNHRSCQPDSVRNVLFLLQKYEYNAIDWDSCWRNMTLAAATAGHVGKKRARTSQDKGYLEFLGISNES